MFNVSAVHGPFVSNVSSIESVSLEIKGPNRPVRPVIRQFTLDRARERAKAAGLGYAGSIYAYSGPNWTRIPLETGH